MGDRPPPQNKFDVNTLNGKKTWFKIFQICFVFYDVVDDGVAPRSAIAAQLTTEVAV